MALGANTVAPCPLNVLRKRAEFLKIADSGKKWVTPGFIIQADLSPPEHAACLRFGLTASKKIGNAVLRNRARRRLRALAHEILPGQAIPGHSFVLIARHQETVARDYDALKKDLLWALKRLELRRHV